MAIEDTFEFMFEASDLASPVVSRAEEQVLAAADGIEEGLLGFADSAEQALESVEVGFADLAASALDHVPAVSAAVVGTGAALEGFSDSVEEAVAAFGYDNLQPPTLWVQLMMKAKTAALGFGVTLSDTSSRVFAFTKGLFDLKKSPVAGVFSAMLGPLGPILTLLSPLISVISKALTPAMEVLSDAVENAFAPFSFVAETVAQSLAPLIGRLLEPFVALLTEGAIQLGDMLQTIGQPGGSGDGIIGAVGGLITYLGEIANELGPMMLDVVTELAVAFKPLVGAVLELGVALLRYVFAPGIKIALYGLLAIIKSITPAIAYVSLGLSIAVEEITARVSEFFGHIAEYGSKFKVLFIDPITSGLGEIYNAFKFDGVLSGIQAVFGGIFDFFKGWFSTILGFIGESITGILNLLGFEGAAAKVAGVFAAIQAAVMSPLQTMKNFLNDKLITPLRDMMNYKLPLIGTLTSATGIKPPEFFKFAEGGIARGPVAGVVGEAGHDELVLPLKRETIRDSLAPAIGDLQLPGLDAVARILERIEALLRAPLAVRQVGGESGGEPQAALGGPRRGSAAEASLDAVPGLAGIG